MIKAVKTPADYLALVAHFPLGPLTSEAHYNTAWKIAEPLVGRLDLTPGQQLYLDALSVFLEQYEEAHHTVNRPRTLTPRRMLEELMDLRGMTVTDLAKVIGSQPLASMILSGKRGISKANITRLAAHFRVDPSAFIDAPPIRLRTPNPSPRRAVG